MENQKLFDFNATASSYLALVFVSALGMYVPFFGWAFAVNYVAKWIADRLLVNGRKIVYQADYGETLKLVTIGALLMFVTLGIYCLWFIPKLYRFVADHMSYADVVPNNIAQTPVTISIDPTAV